MDIVVVSEFMYMYCLSCIKKGISSELALDRFLFVYIYR